jgi:hypothetical protein
VSPHLYLTTDEVAERYRTTPDTARFWRQTGKGPRWVKIGKRVLYPRDAVEEYDRKLAAGAVA